MDVPILNDDQYAQWLRNAKPHHENYLCMYSSWYGGIVKDPTKMMLPIDDHLVHRGDGVFEALKCENEVLYLLDAHIDRLELSAKKAELKLPFSRNQIIEIIVATTRAANEKDCLVRLYVSRGPGGFSPNPYECIGSQLYIVMTKLAQPNSKRQIEGASLKTSKIPIKEKFMATMKNCNYIPNVMMKKEAIDEGVDFTVNIDDNGYLGEGSTENFGIITEANEFLVPPFEQTLKGTTLTRVMELADQLIGKGELTKISELSVSREMAYQAKEIMMFGTTIGVTPIVSFDGKQISDGKPGEFSKLFTKLLNEDVKNSKKLSDYKFGM